MKNFASIVFICIVVGTLVTYWSRPVVLSSVPVTENVTFDKNIKPITSTVCIGCHSSKDRDWSQYPDAFSHRYSILQKVCIDRTMPVGAFLDEKDRALFRDWVNQGGKK